MILFDLKTSVASPRVASAVELDPVSGEKCENSSTAKLITIARAPERGLPEEAREEDEEDCDDEQSNRCHSHEQQPHEAQLVGHLQKGLKALSVLLRALYVARDVFIELADDLGHAIEPGCLSRAVLAGALRDASFCRTR